MAAISVLRSQSFFSKKDFHSGRAAKDSTVKLCAICVEN